MTRRIGMIIAAGIIAIAAAAGIACNDDDEAPTLEAYFAEVQALADRTDDSINQAFDSITDEDDGQQIRDAIDAFAATIEDAAVDFSDIDPATEAEDEHEALDDALGAWASAASDAADRLDDLADDAPAEELFAAVESEEFVSANDAFVSACENLQQVAADNNIDADLNCSDDGDTAGVEQTIRDTVAAWNAADAEALAALFTDDGLKSSFSQSEEATRDEIIAGIAENVGVPPIEITSLAAEITDTGANAAVEWTFGPVLERLDYRLVLAGDEWLIDAEERLAVEAPAEYAIIDVAMTEFAFTFDASPITRSGGFVLNARNNGQQPHHLIIAKVPEDANLEELLAADDPEGVEFIIGMPPVEPGSAVPVVIAGELEPGRYVFSCFLPDTADEAGTPHAFKGMVSELRIE